LGEDPKGLFIGCLGTDADLFAWIFSPLIALAQEFWSTVVLEWFDRRRRDRKRED
jgi:hypothetical protein